METDEVLEFLYKMLDEPDWDDRQGRTILALIQRREDENLLRVRTALRGEGE